MWIFKFKNKEGVHLLFVTLEEVFHAAKLEAIVSLIDNGYSKEDAISMIDGAEKTHTYAALIKPV